MLLLSMISSDVRIYSKPLLIVVTRCFRGLIRFSQVYDRDINSKGIQLVYNKKTWKIPV